MSEKSNTALKEFYPTASTRYYYLKIDLGGKDIELSYWIARDEHMDLISDEGYQILDEEELNLSGRDRRIIAKVIKNLDLTQIPMTK